MVDSELVLIKNSTIEMLRAVLCNSKLPRYLSTRSVEPARSNAVAMQISKVPIQVGPQLQKRVEVHIEKSCTFLIRNSRSDRGLREKRKSRNFPPLAMHKMHANVKNG